MYSSVLDSLFKIGKGSEKMEKQKNTQMLVIVVLSVALLTMAVGFAAFTATLNINGNITVKSTSWNIAFDTNSYSETDGSVTVDASNRTITGTTVTYNVTLTKPGDFYEFTVNVKNTGDFNANLTGISMTSLTEAQAKYLTYTVTYDNGTPYSSTTTGLSNLLAKTNGVAPVKVRVQYVQPANSDDLPSNDVTVSLSASLTYNQTN